MASAIMAPPSYCFCSVSIFEHVFNQISVPELASFCQEHSIESLTVKPSEDISIKKSLVDSYHYWRLTQNQIDSLKPGNDLDFLEDVIFQASQNFSSYVGKAKTENHWKLLALEAKAIQDSIKLISELRKNIA